MRKLDILCASPASTAICSAVDHRSMVRRGHAPLDLHRQKGKLVPNIPCSSHLPILPKPVKQYGTRRNSSADAYDFARSTSRRSKRPGDSARHLLTDNNLGHDHLIEWLSDQNQSPADTNLVHVPKLPPILVRRPHQSTHLLLSENYDSPKLVKSSPSSSPACQEQVVVLRVSLHCKGCEGKVRRHISKMEGVTSFSIEFEKKKVTVIGKVTASGVLASLSRVKNAQLWPSPTSSSSSSSSSSSLSTTRTRSLLIRSS